MVEKDEQILEESLMNSRMLQGYVLPFVVILSVIILTSLGIWYRQVILQSFLSQRLLSQRIIYNECKSLVPIMQNLLDGLSGEELGVADENFYIVENKGEERWRISRSEWNGQKIEFRFQLIPEKQEPIQLTVGYSRD